MKLQSINFGDHLLSISSAIFSTHSIKQRSTFWFGFSVSQSKSKFWKLPLLEIIFWVILGKMDQAGLVLGQNGLDSLSIN